MKYSQPYTSSVPVSYTHLYDRSQKREKRDDKEIGISAVRGGTIVGEHEIIFAGQDEVIEFKPVSYTHLDVYKRQGLGYRSIR